ncbi:tRNA (adenosine(37)-N6)-threonylcarbamoyltransferase complex dimerization subunit type 1 TsaB [Echinicola jeungdonensis]|uniref:tRNA (Adenosine(37)-N6)-threonylcarbamoyltransferase complex dimerization subunit type 1 TsaB n=1 Tax=Echinicola jeungdonensis TaxID=709343 RepID=A0ABV5J520_9BACT|nr:tRNA (adenosine(37)-N6)-threonylcarbamoyltransferase complex dimerization subunit type 1 TsaB [Echinicola jeungdonensis]MDN3669573.1 tRNA (adenosine(37)-N6)-threonylcarbamoyltransferase complex dimerization subunit type 1 TsaB [Echinicola jeungdonensis]
MALILSIETAISVCAVAVHQNGKLVGEIELHQENVHARKLMPSIKLLLDQAEIKPGTLDAVAVSQGPGSYTGLRIGVSTAKGLAFAHDIPLIGVDTLDALAWKTKGFVKKTDFVVPMIDARRMEVYCKVLNGAGEEIEPLSPKIVDKDGFGEYLDKSRVYFLGDAVAKVQEVVLHPNACYLPLVNSASSVGELAFRKYREGEFEDIAYFEPNYLKEFRVIKSKKNPLLL